jgi:magnesium and cobalt transporter
MTKDLNTTGRWLKRLTQGLSAEPQDRAELLAVLREASERGLIDADALTMLEGVLEVGDLKVRDIMVPRAQMVFVRRSDPAARILPVVVESGHSRVPVMDEDRDDIVGILLAKDLLRLSTAHSRERFDIREYMRPAVFVPESKRLNVLLKEFRRSRNHMAIVVDEYGGVAGLCTIEDVIEQRVLRCAPVRAGGRGYHRRARHEAARASAPARRERQPRRLRVARAARRPAPHRRAAGAGTARRAAAARRAPLRRRELSVDG